MTKPSNVVCKNCVFAEVVNKVMGTYECRVEPPRCGDGSEGRPFPQVNANDWCRVFNPQAGEITVPKKPVIVS